MTYNDEINIWEDYFSGNVYLNYKNTELGIDIYCMSTTMDIYFKPMVWYKL